MKCICEFPFVCFVRHNVYIIRESMKPSREQISIRYDTNSKLKLYWIHLSLIEQYFNINDVLKRFNSLIISARRKTFQLHQLKGTQGFLVVTSQRMFCNDRRKETPSYCILYTHVCMHDYVYIFKKTNVTKRK